MGLDEIAAAMLRDPDDIELRRVYADGLLDAGDPRGEHISLAFEAAAGDPVAASRVRILERALEREIATAFAKDYAIRMRWRHGFIEHVALVPRKRWTLSPKLSALFARPEMIALRSFDARGTWPSTQSFAKTLATIAKLLAAKPICWLGVGPDVVGADEIDAMFETFPLLDGLGITTSEPKSAIEAIAKRKLVDLDFGTRELPPAQVIKSIVKHAPRDLEWLVFHGVGGLLQTPLKPILDGSAFPKLRNFGVMAPLNTTKQLLRALVNSPLLPKLGGFGFSAGEVYADGDTNRWLIDQRDRFAHCWLFTAARWPAEENGDDAEGLGHLLKAMNRHADAVPELEHHLDHCLAKAEHRKCREEVGEALLEAKRPQEAIGFLEAAVASFKNKVTSESLPMFQTLGQTLHALERFEEADKVWTRVLDHGAAWCEGWNLRWYAHTLHRLGRHREALDKYDEAIESDYEPEHLAWCHALRGNLLWDMRRMGDATIALEKAREYGSEDAPSSHVGSSPADAARHAWWTEGVMARQARDWKRAKKCLEEAGAQYELGLVLFESGKIKEAHATWKAIVADDVDDQAHALIALDRTRDALALLDTKRSDKGGARACAQLALGDLDAAIAAIDDYGSRPRQPEPLCVYRHTAGALLQGLVHRKAGREDEASALLGTARAGKYDGCRTETCARAAAAVAILAAHALGDSSDADRRTKALHAAIAAGRGAAVMRRLWEARAAASMIGITPEVIDAVERCVSP